LVTTQLDRELILTEVVVKVLGDYHTHPAPRGRPSS
jgi:proteasome lid subunit RPN8/RPN11